MAATGGLANADRLFVCSSTRLVRLVGAAAPTEGPRTNLHTHRTYRSNRIERLSERPIEPSNAMVQLNNQ